MNVSRSLIQEENDPKGAYSYSIKNDTVPPVRIKEKIVLTKVEEERDSVHSDEPVFMKVEIEPGINKKTWNEHLQQKLQQVIEKGMSNGAPAGTYKINSRFLVEKNGTISLIEVLDDPGFGMGEAVKDLIKSSPKWLPGIQNGRAVRAYKTLPLYIVITRE